jgi:catechol 2,3-dioxygenase-like lactoylglutathione lyase family enzyme
MSPQFLVADIEHSIEFYTKKLGFDLEFRYEDFYEPVLTKDGHSILLKSAKPSVEEKKRKI